MPLRQVLSLLFLLTLASAARAQDSGFFIEAQVGAFSNDTRLSVNEGDLPLLFDPEDSGNSYAGLVGYQFNERWFINLSYQVGDADDTELENITGSLNYRFWRHDSGWSAYVGLLGGQSELEWQDDPVVTRFQDRKSEQNFAGGQLGLEWLFADRWQLALNYQYLDLEHTTRLDTGIGRGKFTHDGYQQFNAGLRFLF